MGGSTADAGVGACMQDMAVQAGRTSLLPVTACWGQGIPSLHSVRVHVLC